MPKYPDEYIEYLVQFHGRRDYFECHEILEEYWKEHKGDGFDRAWIGLIQVAVSLYHHRRGNIAGARKMMESAIRNLSVDRMEKLGLDAERFLEMLNERKSLLDMANPDYEDLNIPIRDPKLLESCMKRCADENIPWQRESSLTEELLIHRHTLRDRSDVILARQRELELRKKNKPQ
jgi:predicted metal-dependent hydrolase